MDADAPVAAINNVAAFRRAPEAAEQQQARPSVDACLLENPALIAAGGLFQLYSSESKIIRFLMGDSLQQGDHYEPVIPEVEVLNILSQGVRWVLALVILVVLRKFVLAGVTPPSRLTRIHYHERALIARDIFFHLQCRFWVGTALCFVPACVVPTMATDCLVLVVATISQRGVFYPLRPLIETALRNEWFG